MRGNAALGCSPAACATSSSARPDETSRSKRLAWLSSTMKRTVLSMITAHDHSDAAASPSSTPFTTQSAAMNRWTILNVSGVMAAFGSMGLLTGGGATPMAPAHG